MVDRFQPIFEAHFEPQLEIGKNGEGWKGTGRENPSVGKYNKSKATCFELTRIYKT